MTYQPHTDDPLLHAVLLRGDRTGAETTPEDSPEFDELFGLFLEDRLKNEDRTRFFTLLDASPELRGIVSDYADHLSSGNETPVVEPEPRPPKPSKRSHGAICLLAGVILIGFGLAFFGGRKQAAERQLYSEARRSLQESQFETLKKRLRAAKKQGIESPRLQNLLAQATIQIPAEVSLNVQGTLMDFGVRPNGFLGRSLAPEDPQIQRLEQARAELGQIDTPQEIELLNLGFIQLRQHPDESQKAKAVFQQVIATNPNSSLAWLGRGLASFLQDVYAENPPEEPFAEALTDFQKSVQLDPQNNAARINLATTLTKQGRFEEALGQWKQVHLEKLKSPEREQIEREIQRLNRLTNAED